MIAKLRGVVDSPSEDAVIIDVGGVGYLVFASAKTLARLPRAGGEASLLIETHVREDHIHLYGFAGTEERDWFRLLLTVQGVGAKVALALLSALTPEELQRAIAAGDKAMLSRAQGVGPRLATRLIGELKEKTAAIVLASGGALAPAAAVGPMSDALSALVNLGYHQVEAHAALVAVKAELGDKAGVSSLIRGALKALGREVAR